MSAVLRYITKDGDRWDLIAHKHYGNALLIDGLIRELFKGFRITELNLVYSISRDKTQKTSGELVICNW